MTFTGPDICKLPAHDVRDLLHRKEVSPADLLDAAFARIAQVEPAINAIPTLCEDRARERANDLSGTLLGGIPTGIKDLTAVAGVRTTYGTRGFADHIPDASDPLVTRLEKNGAIVVGKTNTPELGAGGNTFNDVLGITRNPYDTTLNAGGSSGGAAASLATGETWLSHGSDHGGSLRTPAAFCGIVGLRPSPGRASGGADGAGFMIEGVQGPMARSMRDCAMFLDAMAEFDASSPLSYPAPEKSFEQSVIEAEKMPRIAYAPDLGGYGQVDIEMAEHLAKVLETLEKSGARVDETCPDLTHLERTYHTLRGMMWASAARRMPENIRQHFKTTLEENTQLGEALTMDHIADAQLDRTILYANMLSLFETFDVLACPVVGCMPHPQTTEWVHEIGGQTLTGYMDWLRFAFLATTTGLPAISVPVGLGPRGLPVGLQLIGKPRGEAALLQAAALVEQVMGGPMGPIDPHVTHK